MKHLLVFLLNWIILVPLSVAQTIPANRTYDWKQAGLIEPLPSYANLLDMSVLGADMTGHTPCDSVYAVALSQCSVPGQSYTIFFPAGVYTFTNTISLHSNMVLKGTGTTHLVFTDSVICINAQGSMPALSYSITQSSSRHNRYLQSNANASSAQINPGDFIILKQWAGSLVTSTWAYNSVGQFLKVVGVSADTLHLNHELRKDYLVTDTISFYKVIPVQNAGIRCMHITRRNTSVGSYPTIQFLYAYNSFVEGVEMDSCFFSHITLESSGNCQVSGSYFHDAYDYGGNGRAYGVVCQFNSSDHKIENNIFDHQRHSVLMQAGANGNVADYNYSINPYWTEPSLPSNSAGDLVLHGNYVFANLFEGNVCQQAVIDNSHGINGPDNTFFRNRAQGYGIFMNTGPASDNQVFVGNEITNTTLLMGNYILAGTGHFQWGNMKQGVLTPAGTGTLPDLSYCYNTPPAFLSGYAWPLIGIPNAYNTGSTPEQVRNGSPGKTLCDALSLQVLSIPSGPQLKVYPNPADKHIEITGVEASATTMCVTNLLGNILYRGLFHESLDISAWPEGICFLAIVSKDGQRHTTRFMIAR